MIITCWTHSETFNDCTASIAVNVQFLNRHPKRRILFFGLSKLTLSPVSMTLVHNLEGLNLGLDKKCRDEAVLVLLE